MFTAWFKEFFLPVDRDTNDAKRRVLALPVVFNTEIIVINVWDSPQLHDTLKEHDVLLLKPFLVNFVTIFSTINAIDPLLATMIACLRTMVPAKWNTIVIQSMTPNVSPPYLLTDRLSAGLLTPKAFTQLLLPRDRNYQILAKWAIDLECDIEEFLWDAILQKARVLFIPSLKDFHIQFLHRAFHYNKKIATYRPHQSPQCTFCDTAPESYLHLFWQCKYVTPLWTALQTICYDNVDMEDFSQFKCLLSNFQHSLLNILVTLMKHYIHVCKWTSRMPTVFGFVKVVGRTRNIHLKKCQHSHNVQKYYKLWEALAHDIAMNDVINYWESDDD